MRAAHLRTRQRRGEAHGHSARVAGAARWAVFKTIQAPQSRNSRLQKRLASRYGRCWLARADEVIDGAMSVFDAVDGSSTGT